jgi:uncharacterized membrane protein
MQQNPKIKIQLSSADKAIELFTWLLLIAFLGYVIVNYANLPAIIPSHYNALGRADGFSGKGAILALPIIASIICSGLSVLNKYPHLFNYPTKITAANVVQQYTKATQLIRYVKLVIILLFGFIVLQTIRNANKQVQEIGAWLLPFTLSIIFIPIILFVKQSKKSEE